ncbi:MAG: hypothetical protein ABIG95_04725 [Candidatus Woesearchaeota archaeon]
MKVPPYQAGSNKDNFGIKMSEEYHKPSEGEEFIKEFLEEKGISFEEQKKIHLEGDSYSCRYVDFYLPFYEVYIEFLGRQNNQKDRERYLEKKIVYAKNTVPCIYIYPENLGILKFIFRKRL